MTLLRLVASEGSAEPEEPSGATAPLDVSTFRGFCRSIRVTLGAGQEELARVAFDGEQPTASQLSRQLFGASACFNPEHRTIVNIVSGGRAGKSYVLIALRLVWGMIVRDLSSLAPGQRAVALVIARNETLRNEVTAYALGACRSHPELRAMLRLPKGKKPDDVAEWFALKRADGRLVRFEGGVATAGGYGGRGRSLTDFAMDECAFFHDSGYAVNDEDIFRAGSPRVIPGGQTILASTPWAEAGLLYDVHARNYGHPVDAIAVHAPTLVLLNNAFTRALVQREVKRDPDNAQREFFAVFMVGGTTLFFPRALLDASVVEGWKERLPLPGDRVSAGGDFGFRSDSSSLTITHDDGVKIRTGEIVECRPEPGVPLKPSITVGTFAARLKAHGCTHLMADGHYRESIDEHLDTNDLWFRDAPTVPSVVYVRVRALLREGRLEVPDHPRLLSQLRDVQGIPTTGGGITIVHPRARTGGHGDVVAGWVLAVFQLAGDTIPTPPPKPGTLEWEDMQRARRRDALKNRRETPFWKKRERRAA